MKHRIRRFAAISLVVGALCAVAPALANAAPPAPGTASDCPIGIVGGVAGANLADAFSLCVVPGAARPTSFSGFMPLRLPLTAAEAPTDVRIVNPAPIRAFRGWGKTVRLPIPPCLPGIVCPIPKITAYKYSTTGWSSVYMPMDQWLWIAPLNDKWRWAWNADSRTWFAVLAEHLTGYCERPNRGYSNCTAGWLS